MVQQKVVEQQILAEVEVRNQYAHTSHNFATEGTPREDDPQAIMENDLRKDRLRTQNFSKSR